MDQSFMLIPSVMINKLAVAEVLKCNDITSRYGLMLSHTEAQELVNTRCEALSSYGRIEFAGGIIDKLISEFCDSPYLSQFNYADTLNELIETFYYFKNETLEEVSDDELVSLMKQYFDQNCQGCIELLQNRELEMLAHNVRYGVRDYANLFEGGHQSFDEVNEDE